MSCKTRIAPLLVAVLVALPLSARAAETGPGTLAVKRANETISKELKKKVAPGTPAEKAQAAKVTEKVRDFLDIDELGKLSIADYWDATPAAQRTEFLTLLRALVEASYIQGLRANLQYEVVYLGEQAEGQHLVVRTEIRTKRKGRPYTVSVDYKLRKDGNHWRAFDVITDQVGLVENYRAQFRKIIGRDSFEGLLRRMRKKSQSAG